MSDNHFNERLRRTMEEDWYDTQAMNAALRLRFFGGVCLGAGIVFAVAPFLFALPGVVSVGLASSGVVLVLVALRIRNLANCQHKEAEAAFERRWVAFLDRP